VINLAVRRTGPSVFMNTYPPVKMEQSVPKRRAYKIQTPGNYQEESIQHSEHGESLKSSVSMNVSVRENRALYNQIV